MLCPQCNQAMTAGQRVWMCEECGYRAALAPDESTAPKVVPGLQRLPSLLAITLREYATETGQPVLQLHRLCDAIEVITRFCTIAALGELRRQVRGAPLPDGLVPILRNHIERPTLGRWKELLGAVVMHIDPMGALVVPELLGFVRDDLVPGLETGPAPTQAAPQTSKTTAGRRRGGEGLIDLRNTLVHGGAMPRAEASFYLDDAEWGAWLTRLAERLQFLGGTEVCYLADGTARRLVGPGPELGTVRPLSADLSLAFRDLNHPLGEGDRQ